AVMMAPFTLLVFLATGKPGVLVQAAIGATYVSNFVQAVTPQPKLFSHLWSLAEEEQFYLLWPFILGWLLSRRVRPALVVGAVAAIFSLDGRALYEGPMAAFAIAAAILVAAIADNPGSLIARALSWRPLRRLGRISYGVYLWHLPLFLIAGPVIGTVLA